MFVASTERTFICVEIRNLGFQSFAHSLKEDKETRKPLEQIFSPLPYRWRQYEVRQILSPGCPWEGAFGFPDLWTGIHCLWPWPKKNPSKQSATAFIQNEFGSEKVATWWIPSPHFHGQPLVARMVLWRASVVSVSQSETSLNSCFLKGLSVPPKQETFTSEENWRRGKLCWWCRCHILLVHGWVSPGTGGMSFTDRNCIIKLDRILTFSWQCNLFIK